MKTMLRTFLCTALVLLTWAVPAHAQRLLTTTTTAAAVAQGDDTLTVASSTGFTVGQLIFIDWEVMRIQNLNGVAGTSTLINVQRGVDGTGRRGHSTSERIIVTANNTDFHNTDPSFGEACARGSGEAAILPWINVRTGNIFTCGQVGGATVWSTTNTLKITYDSIPTSF